jgi:protocatechuate 3,4-dioxygenase beta subunit
MNPVSRRDFVAAGLAALGVGGLTLRADAQPTPSAGDPAEHYRVARVDPVRPARVDKDKAKDPAPLVPTEDCILGPFHRSGAPFRAKVTPPLEPGVLLLIKGRVWGQDTRKPLPFAQLDIWQANAKGRYDNDDPDHPPKKDVFLNRARLITDENGAYEFETIHPGAYKIGPDAWRPSHIHYWIAATGYKSLITQLFFKGDPHNKTDEFIKNSLIIELSSVKVGDRSYEMGVFDIVLAKGK